jgi:hypothetical protein
VWQGGGGGQNDLKTLQLFNPVRRRLRNKIMGMKESWREAGFISK